MVYYRKRRFGRKSFRRSRFSRKSRLPMRRPRGRRSIYGRRSRIPATINSPRKLVTRMKYVDKVVLTPPAAGQADFYWFRGNSIHDPDLEGTGHQPMGHDQAATLYQNYRVRGSKVSAQVFQYGGASVNMEGFLMLYNAEDLEALDTMTAAQLLEKPRMMHKRVSWQANDPRQLTISKYASTRSSIPSVAATDDDLSAAFGYNPGRQWVWGVGWAPASGSATAAVEVVVTITYYVELTSPIVLAQS